MHYLFDEFAHQELCVCVCVCVCVCERERERERFRERERELSGSRGVFERESLCVFVYVGALSL